jgi:hypothetical protein
LQDVKTLNLTPNPAPLSKDPSAESSERPQFVCPLTLKEMNGTQPFVYLSTCGCVFSQAGFKTVAASTSPKEKETADAGVNAETPLDLCPQCAKKYSTGDVVLLNPSSEEEETLRFALERKRLQEPTKKKSKKRKNDSSLDEAEPPAKKQAAVLPGLNPSISGASRAIASELAMEEAKRKTNMSAAVKSLYGDGSKRKETFMTMGTFTRVCACFCFVEFSRTDLYFSMRDLGLLWTHSLYY